MNCQEYRDMIEDALDVSLHGELATHVRRHLEHCADCRDYFAARRAEHVALFANVNAAYSHLRPPPSDFVARLTCEVEAQRMARRGWRRFALPRWALIAASLVAMAGFVFAATVVVDAVIAKDDDSEAMEGRAGDNVPPTTEGTDGSDALAASETGGTRSVASSEVPETPSVSYVPSTDNQQQTIDNQQPSINNQQSTLKREKAMTKRKAAAAALTAAMAATPLAAANGDEYQFIDPTTYPAANYSYATSSSAITLNAGAVPVAGVSGDLEARSRSNSSSTAIMLNALPFKGCYLTIR